MADPASLNVDLNLRGLDPREIAAVVAALPPGASWAGATTQPAIGGPRHQISITDLSIGGAAFVATALLAFAEERAQMGGGGDG
nr:hypothetical protein [Micromonospora sp. DSM 115978]